MNESILRDLAEAIAREQFLLQWPIYALMVAIAMVVGFAAAFVGAYAKKRGESFATKTDFDELLAQLKTTTEVAEDVKARISHADWAARELKTLRRRKLEELLEAVHEMQAWQDMDAGFRLYGSQEQPSRSPLPRVERLTGLYFPELEESVHSFCQAHRKMQLEIIKTQKLVLNTGQNAENYSAILEGFQASFDPLHRAQLEAISTMEKQARHLVAEIVGAEG